MRDKKYWIIRKSERNLTLIEWPEKIEKKLKIKLIYFLNMEKIKQKIFIIKGLSNEKLNELDKSKLKKIKGDASFRSFYRKKIIIKNQL